MCQAIPFGRALKDNLHSFTSVNLNSPKSRLRLLSGPPPKHSADLEDGKFQRAECFGLGRVFKGWAKLGFNDAEILAKGFDCFEALYNWLRK